MLTLSGIQTDITVLNRFSILATPLTQVVSIQFGRAAIKEVVARCSIEKKGFPLVGEFLCRFVQDFTGKELTRY